MCNNNKEILDKVIHVNKRGIIINGKYTILLCASLFYFRIPEGLWRDRMKKLRFLGYNCIDVYFPWNYHEIKKDTWLFSGQRDVDKFLTMAKEEGLYVVARPGPYICSEWDGGGLPAYLFVEEDIKIRDNDQRYLSYVNKWYDHILPIIAKHQVTNGGSVVLVQLENELDFFECEDREGYMLALKQMADKHGIEVPCIACAGQGDLYGAWGQVKGIIPSMNLYLDPTLPNMEQELEYYCKQLQEMDVPLLVTETGREHFLLRRLLSSGAKLLGAYNQVAGTNFGFTSSVNNWGNPVSFIASNYDFKSLIDAFGRITTEVYEARLLSGFINSMGQSLAGSLCLDKHEFKIVADGKLGYTKVPVLSLLQEGSSGFVVSVTNIDKKPVNVTISRAGYCYPQKTKMIVPPKKSRFTLFNFALSNWGLPGRIIFSSAEPFCIIKGDCTIIVFHADYEGEVQFEFGENRYTFVFSSDKESREEIVLSSGKKIILYGIASSKAAMLSEVTDKQLYYFPDDYFKFDSVNNTLKIYWTQISEDKGENDFEIQPIHQGEEAVHMEEAGLYRGYGWYKGSINLSEDDEPVGILLHNAADIVSVYCNGKYMDTLTPAGSHAFVNIPENSNDTIFNIVVRTEIWGHSNFDDSRKPALRLKSLRGFNGATLITSKKRIHLWNLKLDYRRNQHYQIKTGFGRWLTTRKPVKCTYYKKVRIDDDKINRCFLYFEGIQCNAVVNVDGEYVGEVDNFNNYIDISSFIKEKKEVEISVTIEKRYYAEPSGNVYLLTGIAVRNWTLTGCDEEGLWRIANKKFSEELIKECNMPLVVQPGSVMWLFGEIESDEPFCSYILRFKGQNAKLTVFFNGTIVGRIWLPSSNRPIIVGGTDDVAYLPSCWFNEKHNIIAIMVEAIEKEQCGMITSIESQPVEFSLK